jgi:hypothetical protein
LSPSSLQPQRDDAFLRLQRRQASSAQ